MHGEGIALQILGTGEYVPRRRVESTELDRRCWHKAEGWTANHTGVEVFRKRFCYAPTPMLVFGKVRDLIAR